STQGYSSAASDVYKRQKVYQDMELYRWALLKDEQSVHQIAAERRVWIQVVKGEVTINGTKATTSDGLAIWDEQAISVHADSDSAVSYTHLRAHETLSDL
ncbi:hypothetical protein QLF84_24710, partial [Salmonella enterica subsp. enterica serovar Oslo]|nr:hypothetical protein [Salmonella enterica subsp. enterica serovar Oslo]